MNQKFVYLILSQRRLVILSSKMHDKDYHELMNTADGPESFLITTCKMFCIGFIMGSQSGTNPVNLLEEFQ